MSTRHDRDKNKSQQERHQMILSQLLKDEDNKYCVDCDAKGPRWASWNLGIFLCIRCAGIHRNMGVHISKVKSVNLDTWTPEQIAMVQEMGNSRARAVYEANLPDNFRRPQTDSGLEAFIRSKYEHKKYIAKEWVPPQPKILQYEDDPSKKDKKKASRPRPAASTTVNNPPAITSTKTRPESRKVDEKPTVKETAPAASVDLLSLDNPAPAPGLPSQSSNDLFGDFIGSDVTASNIPQNTVPPAGNDTSATAGSSISDLNDMNLFSESANSQEKQKATKESILALYGSSGAGSQMFGVPGGMYMPQQVSQQQMWQQPAAAVMSNGMMPASMAMNSHANMMPGNQNASVEANDLMMVDPMNSATSLTTAQMMDQQAYYSQQGMWGQPYAETNPFLQKYVNVPYNLRQWNSQYAPQMGVDMQSMMMGQMGGMAAQPGMMYTAMPGMYGIPQQMQQIQGQMSAMNLGGMPGMPQAGMVTAVGMAGNSWGAQTSGQTLSNNLWQ